ncbi:MAG TPA: hypothetical protein VI072_07750, partial [Polyangiaceae bacterium]
RGTKKCSVQHYENNVDRRTQRWQCQQSKRVRRTLVSLRTLMAATGGDGCAERHPSSGSARYGSWFNRTGVLRLSKSSRQLLLTPGSMEAPWMTVRLRLPYVLACLGILVPNDRAPAYPPAPTLRSVDAGVAARPSRLRPAAGLLERTSGGGVLLDVDGNVWRFHIDANGERHYRWVGSVDEDAVRWIDSNLRTVNTAELRDVGSDCADCEFITITIAAYVDSRRIVLRNEGNVRQLRMGREARTIVTWFDALLDSFWPKRFRFAEVH